MKWSGAAPEETHFPPAGGMQPASQLAGLERSAPTLATGVHGAVGHGKPRRLQDLLPLPPPTHRTPEKTQEAPPRRTSVMLRSLFGPLLSAADDVVEAYRRPATSPDRGHDVQTSPQGWQATHPQALFATPTAKISAGDHLACKTSTNTVQMAPECRGLTSTMAGMVHVPLLGMHMDNTPSPAPWTSGSCSILLSPAAKTTPYGATPATGEPVSTFCAAEAPGENPRPLTADMRHNPTYFPLSDLNG